MKNFEFRNDAINHYVFDHIDEPSVLDVGSSDGRKSSQLFFEQGQNPANWTSLDVDQDSLRVLEELGCVTYQIKLVVDKIDSIIDSQFDVVLCTEVLEHFRTLEEQLSLLQECIDRTEKYLVISFPEKPRLDKKKYGHKCKEMNVSEIKKVMYKNFDYVILLEHKSGQIILIGEK
jgi:hypothetical protein